jgi:hypothetical protein
MRTWSSQFPFHKQKSVVRNCQTSTSLSRMTVGFRMFPHRSRFPQMHGSFGALTALKGAGVST